MKGARSELFSSRDAEVAEALERLQQGVEKLAADAKRQQEMEQQERKGIRHHFREHLSARRGEGLAIFCIQIGNDASDGESDQAGLSMGEASGNEAPHCDICGKALAVGVDVAMCEPCDYAVCPEHTAGTCPAGHKLQPFHTVGPGRLCDVCGRDYTEDDWFISCGCVVTTCASSVDPSPPRHRRCEECVPGWALRVCIPLAPCVHGAAGCHGTQ